MFILASRIVLEGVDDRMREWGEADIRG